MTLANRVLPLPRAVNLAVCMLALAATGCVPIPILSPPARISQSAGVAVGQIAPPRDATVADRRASPVLTTRLGVHPQQMFPSLFSRRFDLGAGYLFEVMPEPGLAHYFRHGPYLELGANLWMAPISESWAVRTSTSVHADALFANDMGSEFGIGVGGSISIELVSFAGFAVAEAEVSEYDSHALLGAVSGEWGIGLTAGVDYRSVQGMNYGVFQLGLFVRLPAAAGILLVPLHDDDSRSRRNRSPSRSRGQSVGEVVTGGQGSHSGSRPSVEVRGTN